MPRWVRFAAFLLLQILAARASAVMQLRNLYIRPEYICPGQVVTLHFQENYSTNNGNYTWGVFSTNNSIWDDPNDYTYMDSAHVSGGTAASSPGTPGGLQIALAGGASDGFWHDYSFVTTIPASITGTNITFLLRGHDGAGDWAFSTTYDAQLSLTTELTCAKKAVYNSATLWEQESTARLVIQNSCGTPSFTPTRTPTKSATPTPSATLTRTPTATPSVTLTPSPSLTVSSTPSSTLTPSPTPTASFTASPPFTSTSTPTRTDSFTPSDTPSVTLTPTSTATRSQTPTPTSSYTNSFTPTQTLTQTATPSATPSITDTPIYSPTATPSQTATPSVTPSATETATFSNTATPSGTPTVTPSATATQTFSFTPTATPSRTVTLTFTDSPTRTISPTITPTPIPVPYQVSVTVYNAAGERVRLLFDGSAAVLPTDVNLDRTVIRSGLDGVTLDLRGALSGGGSTLFWLGQNDGGQAVKGGVYYFKLEYRDPFGSVTSFTKSLQVLEGKSGSQLDIFNAAGELVYRTDFSGLTPTVTSFSLQKDVLTAAYSADGSAQDAIQGSLQLSDGSQLPIAWDGRGMDGRPLAAGVYSVVLIAETQQGTQIASKSITVIRAVDAGLSWQPLLGPNPAPAQGGPWGRRLQVRYPAGELLGVRARLFNQAGEKVGEADDPGGTGTLWLVYENTAGGVYLVALEGRLASGSPYRRVLKAAILR